MTLKTMLVVGAASDAAITEIVASPEHAGLVISRVPSIEAALDWLWERGGETVTILLNESCLDGHEQGLEIIQRDWPGIQIKTVASSSASPTLTGHQP